ncbi:MAG: HAMP domain-containing protein [Planctomycetota bacterium]|jgi:HAMP domain-containing protein
MKSSKDQTPREGKEKRNSESVRPVGLKKGDAIHNVPNFAKKIWIYLSLAILSALTLGGVLIYEVGSDHLRGQLPANIVGQLPEPDKEPADISEIGGILKRLQNRIILVTSVIFLAVIVGIFFLIRNVIKPLDEMGRAAFKMAHGNLDQVVPVRSRSEIGKIGELINDLAIDLQEILLHVWNHTRQDIVLLDRIAAIMNSQPGGNGMPQEIREDFYFVRQDIEDMRDMVKAFNYYNVRLHEEKVLVNDHPQKEGEYHD